MASGTHNISVVVRVRYEENTSGDSIAWKWSDTTMEQTLDESTEHDEKADLFRSRSASGIERNFHNSDSFSDMHKGVKTSRSLMSFEFDNVYGPECMTADIFDTSLKELVLSACSGFNGTIFAYGPTGSGKTHSIIGSNEDPGLFPLTLMEIFKYIAENSSEQFLLQVAYYEIDNEDIVDLLRDDGDDNNKSSEQKALRVVDSPENGPVILGLTTVPVSKPEDAVEQLLRGNHKRRRMEGNHQLGPHPATHAVLQLRIESTPGGATRSVDRDDGLSTRVAQLNLIDLAGSEKMIVPGSVSAGPKMNASLLSLGNVIANLAENSPHIPYRDSKLTRLLSTSLGGNARTAILCTVCPEQKHLSNTLNTLRFGSRAMTVTNRVRKNSVRSASSEMERYKKQIDTLRRQLMTVRAGSHALATEDENLQLKSQLKQMEDLLLDSNSAATKEVKSMVDHVNIDDANDSNNVDHAVKRKKPTYRRKSIVFSAAAMQQAVEGVLEGDSTDGTGAPVPSKQVMKKRSARGRRRLSMAMGNAMTRMSIDSSSSTRTGSKNARTLSVMNEYDATGNDGGPSTSAAATTIPTPTPTPTLPTQQQQQHNQYSNNYNTKTNKSVDMHMQHSSDFAQHHRVDSSEASPKAIKMIRQEMEAQMKTILKLQDKLATVDEEVFDEQRKNYQLTDELRKETLEKKATEKTCEQLQDMLKTVRGHFEDSEEKTSSRTERVQQLLMETRRTVAKRDEAIIDLKEQLKIEISKRNIISEAESKATTKQALADFYFQKLVDAKESREAMERLLMANEERLARDIEIVLNQSETWDAMDRKVKDLEHTMKKKTKELNVLKNEAIASKRSIVSLQNSLVEARSIAEKMEAFSMHLASEMEGEHGGGGKRSQLYEHRSTPTTKLLKSLAEKSQSRVMSLTRSPKSTAGHGNGGGGGGGGGGGVSSYNQAALVRELTEKLRDSEFKVAGLELARELDAQQRARLETMINDLENGMNNLQVGSSAQNLTWTSVQPNQSLASVAVRELDSLRRELSSIGSRDSDRMSQIKQINYVNNGLDAMGYEQDRNVVELRKNLIFFKPLLREELAYTVDELVVLNERLHVSVYVWFCFLLFALALNLFMFFFFPQVVESQVLGRAIEVGDRIGAPARWQHASPLRIKTIGGMGRTGSPKGKGQWR